MSAFSVEEFVRDVRAAAAGEDAVTGVRQLMDAAFADPAAVAEGMSGFKGEDEVLFEDDTVSIWYCGFDPEKHIPPHDHQTHAIIGVYGGAELNHFYLAKDGQLDRRSSKVLNPGDVISLGPNTIHSVETADENVSCAIHVYLAPLTTIERSLFDWETGATETLNETRVNAQMRPSTKQALQS